MESSKDKESRFSLRLTIIIAILFLLGQIVLAAVWVTNTNRDIEERPTKEEVRLMMDQRLSKMERQLDEIYNFMLKIK